MSATAVPGQGVKPAGVQATYSRPPGITRQATIREQGEGILNRLSTYKTKICPAVTYVLYFLCSLDCVLVIIGSIYIHRCPVKPFIPQFLIILGVIGLAAKLLTNLKSKFEEYKTVITGIESLLHTASTIVFIVGMIFVYNIYQPSYKEYFPNYCNKTCYLFAFVYVTIYLILIILGILLSCCVCCCAMFGMIASDDGEDNTTQQV